MAKSKPISELRGMSTEDALTRCRERVINMYETLGMLDEALLWLAKDLTARQRGE